MSTVTVFPWLIEFGFSDGDTFPHLCHCSDLSDAMDTANALLDLWPKVDRVSVRQLAAADVPTVAKCYQKAGGN